jgi:sec-independent protein translocase protein TatB
MMPGLGFSEIAVLALIALLVVGPRDLPLLLRKVGRGLNRVRAMADDFRASMDEVARQTELDDLRREVEKLRVGAAAPVLPAPGSVAPAAAMPVAGGGVAAAHPSGGDGLDLLEPPLTDPDARPASAAGSPLAAVPASPSAAGAPAVPAADPVPGAVPSPPAANASRGAA